MATRRVKSTEKPSDDAAPAAPVLPKGMQAEKMRANPGPAIPAEVLVKLFGFTAAMLIAPIGCYYLSTNVLFPGSTVTGASIAAVVANVVLIAFVVVAMREDDGEESKKNK
ncbi:vacuolar ATPase assembly integral membrane protein vma21 [Orbilia brochopaga]|uniref:Vacuolar ATPase assembly integral membrane protein vma21 n=1 Tax=Orbilia brochopaga TaxID=3140254 RepID=A0AAV9UAJ4_9PEZI